MNPIWAVSTDSMVGLGLVIGGIAVGLLGPPLARGDVVALNMFRQALGRQPADESAARGFRWARLIGAGVLVIVGIGFLILG